MSKVFNGSNSDSFDICDQKRKAHFQYGRFIHEQYFSHDVRKDYLHTYVDVGAKDGEDSKTFFLDHCVSPRWAGLCVAGTTSVWEAIYLKRSCTVIPPIGKNKLHNVLRRENVTNVDYLNVEMMGGRREVDVIRELLNGFENDTMHVNVKVITVGITERTSVEVESVMHSHGYKRYFMHTIDNNGTNSVLALFLHHDFDKDLQRMHSVTNRITLLPAL